MLDKIKYNLKLVHKRAQKKRLKKKIYQVNRRSRVGLSLKLKNRKITLRKSPQLTTQKRVKFEKKKRFKLFIKKYGEQRLFLFINKYKKFQFPSRFKKNLFFRKKSLFLLYLQRNKRILFKKKPYAYKEKTLKKQKKKRRLKKNRFKQPFGRKKKFTKKLTRPQLTTRKGAEKTRLYRYIYKKHQKLIKTLKLLRLLRKQTKFSINNNKTFN